MTRSIAVVPFWLRDAPQSIEYSDNYWWIRHLSGFDVVIYCGPYIDEKIVRVGKQLRYSVRSDGLAFSLLEIFGERPNRLDISPCEVTLYWHVMEVAATCRVTDLDILSCPRVCVIGDTHHMKSPVSGLFGYLASQPFTHVSCSHNQYNPFFASLFGLEAIDFPFALPSTYIARLADKEYYRRQELYYYGSILSRHHIHRSRIVNQLLVDQRISGHIVLKERMNFQEWTETVMRPHLNLTCSLNGTFSFQTFLPMLGRAVVYTDPISRSNWVGKVLEDNINCMIYNGGEDLIARLLADFKENTRLAEIGQNAHNVIADFLIPEEDLARKWMNGIPLDRRLATNEEYSLQVMLNGLIKRNGINVARETVGLFEDIQELHRVFWQIIVQVRVVVVTEQEAQNALTLARCLIGMLSILPRATHNIIFVRSASLSDSENTSVRVSVTSSQRVRLEASWSRVCQSTKSLDDLADRRWIKTYPERET